MDVREWYESPGKAESHLPECKALTDSSQTEKGWKQIAALDPLLMSAHPPSIAECHGGLDIPEPKNLACDDLSVDSDTPFGSPIHSSNTNLVADTVFSKVEPQQLVAMAAAAVEVSPIEEKRFRAIAAARRYAAEYSRTRALSETGSGVGVAADASPVDSYADVCTPPEFKSAIPLGAIVKVEGFPMADLNGRTGVICNFDSVTQRYSVNVEMSKKLGCAPGMLVSVEGREEKVCPTCPGVVEGRCAEAHVDLVCLKLKEEHLRVSQLPADAVSLAEQESSLTCSESMPQVVKPECVPPVTDAVSWDPLPNLLPCPTKKYAGKGKQVISLEPAIVGPRISKCDSWFLPPSEGLSDPMIQEQLQATWQECSLFLPSTPPQHPLQETQQSGVIPLALAALSPSNMLEAQRVLQQQAFKQFRMRNQDGSVACQNLPAQILAQQHAFQQFRMRVQPGAVAFQPHAPPLLAHLSLAQPPALLPAKMLSQSRAMTLIEPTPLPVRDFPPPPAEPPPPPPWEAQPGKPPTSPQKKPPVAPPNILSVAATHALPCTAGLLAPPPSFLPVSAHPRNDVFSAPARQSYGRTEMLSLRHVSCV